MNYYKWIKSLSYFTIIQVLVQGINAVAGLLIVRNFPKDELAYYTIIATVLTTLLNVSDMGLNSSLIAIGSKKNDESYLNEVFSSALYIRKRLMVVALIYAIIISFFFFKKIASISYILIILTLTLTEWIIRFYSTLMDVYARIKQHLNILQVSALLYNGIRSGFIIILIISLPYTWITCLSGVFAALICYRYYKKNTLSLNYRGPVNLLLKKELLVLAKKQWLFIVYSLFQYQISLFLISYFGNTTSLADFGALSRLAILFQILNTVLSTIVCPAFSKITDYKKASKILFLIYFSYSCLSLVLYFFVKFAPYLFLALIGKQYEYLSKELLIMVVATLLSNASIVILNINQVKGWLGSLWFVPIASTLIQVVYIYLYGVSSLANIILMSVYVNMAVLLINVHMNWKGMQKMKLNNNAIS
ncbi:MAG: hypothetical protein J0I09_05285 [Sphingobacteriia bacterium]|nr:hypothetical protein [Sphingobacteriia bacterium]